MSSSTPNLSASAPSHDWDTYFYTHFEGPMRLKKRLIRGLVARICSSDARMMRRIERRGQKTRYFEVIQVLGCDNVVADLKYVAEDDAEVRELIVGFVRSSETIFGEARKEIAAMEEDTTDEDGREPMVKRARTFKEIVAEIGTTRSRRVERAMQCAEEGRQLAPGDEDSDELSDALSEGGLDVLATKLRPGFSVGTTNLNKVDDLKSKQDVPGSGNPAANWLERLQYESSSTPNTPPSGLSDDLSKDRVRLVLFLKDHRQPTDHTGSIAKNAA